MAGLQAATAAPEAVEEEGTPASEEEQAVYDEVVARAYMLIFDEKTKAIRESVAEMLKDDDPKEALGQTTATIFSRVIDAAAQADMQIPGDVKLAAFTEIYEKLAEVATKVGAYDFMADDEAFSGSFVIAVDHWRVMAEESGAISDVELAEDLDEMVAMDGGPQAEGAV